MRAVRIIPTLFAAVALASALAFDACAQADPTIRERAASEKQALLDTLKSLVEIETGSRDIEGLDRLAALVAERLRALGGEVDVIEPPAADVYRMEDTPEKIGKVVRGVFRGSGTKKILLIAHMDTVYPRGMLAKQPFRIEGPRAYGLGIADDKQGVALILHSVKVLKDLGFREYGTLTVLLNGDEEIGSPASRTLLTRHGAEADATLSFEASRVAADKLQLATLGIASVTLKVRGRASHAGSRPEAGINSLYEMAHQVLQMRDLSEPERGIKMNWTVANAGFTRNVIPPEATAQADVRIIRVEDYDRIESRIRERMKNQLVKDAKVELLFERSRPPLAPTDAARGLARHAQAVYKELGLDLSIDESTEGGGGTDAAFAALGAKGAVVERFGLRGYGAHTTESEYVLIDSIEPRLYLVARLVMDVSRGKWKAGETR